MWRSWFENLSQDAKRYADELKGAQDKSEVDPRSGLGQKFSRWLKQGKSPEEAAKNQKTMDDFVKEQSESGVKKNQAKANFRLHWAQLEINKLSVNKTEKEIFRKIESEKGEMKYFSVLVESMGYFYDPPGATERARKYSMA